MKPNWKPPKHVERMQKLENQYEKDVVKVVKETQEALTLFPQCLIDAILAVDASIIQAMKKFAEMDECPRTSREISIKDLKLKEGKE